MQKCIVQKAIVDLKSEPKEEAPLESQLLLGDPVYLIKEQGEWAYAAAPEQLRFRKELGWHPYPGWVEKAALTPVDTLPKLPSPPQLDRDKIIIDAHHFLGLPYLWGGRSKKAVDCSGLIHLLFRTQNICIPRDAHDQYLKSQKIDERELLPGDLLFFTPIDKPERVTHVLLYQDKESCIESASSGKGVRIFPLKFMAARIKKEGYHLGFGRWLRDCSQEHALEPRGQY